MARSDLEAILQQLATDTAEFNADDFRARVLATYDEDISIRDNAVRERETNLENATKEIDRWKLKNYDLLMQLPADPKKVETPGQKPNGSGDPDESATVDSLFGKE